MPRTYPPQISQQADERMNQLSAVIGRAKLRIQKFQRVHDNAWEECFSILDEFNTDETARFIARDGHTIQRQRRQRSEFLNEEALHNAMLVAYGNEEKWFRVTEPVLNPAFAQDSNALFAKLFEVLGESEAYRHAVEAISVRQVNTTLLSQAYATDVNLRQMTQEAMTVPEPTFARVRPEWTRDDVNRAAVFGIFKVPIEDRDEVIIPRAEYDELMRITGNAQHAAIAAAQEEPEEPSSTAEPSMPEGEAPRRGRGRPRRNPVAQ